MIVTFRISLEPYKGICYDSMIGLPVIDQRDPESRREIGVIHKVHDNTRELINGKEYIHVSAKVDESFAREISPGQYETVSIGTLAEEYRKQEEEPDCDECSIVHDLQDKLFDAYATLDEEREAYAELLAQYMIAVERNVDEDAD